MSLNQKIRLNTLFVAHEGEGVCLGRPQVFIRFQGCAVGCRNCDTKESWNFEEGQDYTLDLLIKKVVELGGDLFKRVSITGGDPLHPKHETALYALILALKERGYFINLEAAGTRYVPFIFEKIDFISFDYKTPSTGVKTSPEKIGRLIKEFPQKFQIKSVIENRGDFDDVLRAYLSLKENFGEAAIRSFPWCLTPSYPPGISSPLSLFKDIMAWNLEAGGPFLFIGQQHKWVFGPDMKDV